MQASPRARVNSFTFSVCGVFSGGLPLALYSVKLRAVVQLSFFSGCSVRLALFSGPLAPYLAASAAVSLEQQSDSPLTLVFRLFASADLLLYWTSLPP
jgi:hypothetical protein